MRFESAPEPVVIYAPPGPEHDRWLLTCLAYAEERGYRVVSRTDQWDAALAVLTSGQAAVGVVARRDHLPPNRRPRVEVVSEQPEQSLRRRRPQRRTWVVL